METCGVRKPSPAEKVAGECLTDEEDTNPQITRLFGICKRIGICKKMLSSSTASGPPSPLEKAQINTRFTLLFYYSALPRRRYSPGVQPVDSLKTVAK